MGGLERQWEKTSFFHLTDQISIRNDNLYLIDELEMF
jgi:hypothetical protein